VVELHYCGHARAGHTDIVVQLLKHGKVHVNLQDSQGETALMLASTECRTDIVRTLLQDKNVDVNIRSKRGRHCP
jgi:ankyrin repeat protein